MTDVADRLLNEWNEFKVANDARQAEIAKYGTATAETTARVEAINGSITALQNQLSEAQKRTDSRIEEVENRLNRPNVGGLRMSDIPEARLRAYADWQMTATGKPVELEQVDLARISAYNREWNTYMRGGHAGPIMNEMSEGSAPDGGYLVSPDLSGRTATLQYETSPMRQIADVQTISTDSLEGMKDLDTGTSGGWVGEITARTNTATPQIGMWKVELAEQYAMPRITQRLLDDTRFDVEGWLAGKVADILGRTENTAYVTGNGVLQPRGFTTYTAGTPTAALWEVVQQVPSLSAAALTADGIVNLAFSLKSAYRAGAMFGMNRATEAKVRLLKDGNGNYLWQPNFSVRSGGVLLGDPVVEMPDMVDISAGAEPIVYGNMRMAYQIVDHASGLRTLRDPYTAKPYVVFYSTKRTGGAVVNFEAIKLQTVAAS